MNYKKPAFWIIIASVLACIVVGICFMTDPKDREPDTSLLNYENAGSVLSDRTYVDAIFCPPVDKNEDGQISLGYVKGIELAEYLDQVSWQEWKAPEEGLSSPGSVEFFIDTDCQITVYRKPRRAKVTYKEKVRYYKTHGGDYEDAVKLYHTRNAEPAVMKWFDSFNEDNMIWDGSREISPEEFPGVTFRWEPEKLEAVTEKETVTLCTGMPIWSVFFCDLNGDGKPELCLTVSFGSGMIDNRIEVIDYANHAFYELSDRGRYDYSLSLRMNGQLCAEKRAYMQDEILASGQLVLREIMGIDGNVMSSLMIEEGDPEEADQEEETEKRFSLDEGRYVLEKALHSEEIFRFNKLFS